MSRDDDPIETLNLPLTPTQEPFPTASEPANANTAV